ncbi:DUF305 domain-containing protein [Paracoccus sp. Z118]|uniref:CopM family metallochaperone n=1 Tax=Paracoccus sp. Z118 TaxID=2851017 RepID=UPI0020B70394|nr:DUF305 domain-containing protein [Paracoccus sp. Z118]
MMQAMSRECMSAMQQMMQGGILHGGVAAPPGGEAASADTDVADFTQAYVDAMNEMHAPMMDGVMAADPDVAFVRGMIPHHQGAIDMARIVQQYGDDPQTKAWAGQIIEAQEREIAETEAWLTENGDTQPFELGQSGGTVLLR